MHRKVLRALLGVGALVISGAALLVTTAEPLAQPDFANAPHLASFGQHDGPLQPVASEADAARSLAPADWQELDAPVRRRL